MSVSNTVTAANTPKVNPPLGVPNPSPNVRMGEPDFEKLTTAEKLNDRRYRELVYQTYPNEATCACEPEISLSVASLCNGKSDVEKSPSNFLVCRSGCKRACCSSVRQPGVASSEQDNANKDDKVPPAPFMPTYCVGSPRGSNEYDEDERRRRRRIKAHNGGYCGVESRLRGGGEGGEGRGEEGMYPQSEEVNRATVRSFGDAWNGRNGCVVGRRMEGGGGGGGIGYEYTERYPANRSPGLARRAQCYTGENSRRGYPRARHTEDSHLDTSHLRAAPNACASATLPPVPVAAGCCCPGKSTLVPWFATRQRGNRGTCAKRSSPGVDGLIKKLRETQEFVESLGKVPGVAGLGLMDPSESPYFGRARTKPSSSEAIEPSATFSGLASLPNPQCVGPCNPQMLRRNLVGDGPLSGATSFTIAVPGRGGVVREAVPSLPGPGLRYPSVKLRKKDDREKLKEADTGSVQAADIESSGGGGPCGESRCKARRRKSSSEPAASPPVESTDDPANKSTAHANINGRRISRAVNKVKGSGKMRSGHRSSLVGPGGDRTGRTKSAGKSGRRTMRFVYSAGDAYSGLSCGHKGCIEDRRRVPWNMGWLWNLNQTVGRLKPRVGWKPGAIARHISEILREAKANFLPDHKEHKSRPKTRSAASSRSASSRSAPSTGKRTKLHRDRRPVKKAQPKKKEEAEEEPEPPPTLYIHRKDGTYYITMYPIKQDNTEIPKLEEPMKPLQFKITKNKDDASAATSSTASDMEIEFSPPAAVNRYRKKPNVVHVDTQVRQQEIIAAFKSDDGKKKEKKKGKKSKK